MVYLCSIRLAEGVSFSFLFVKSGLTTLKVYFHANVVSRELDRKFIFTVSKRFPGKVLAELDPSLSRCLQDIVTPI